LSVYDYCEYIHHYKKHISEYVALDVIPGLPRQSRTKEQREESARASYANLQIMKNDGLNPIPVFHGDEDEKWFDQMLVDGEEYIGVSLGKDLKSSSNLWLLDRLFSKICSDDGKPRIKIHGFGITNTILLQRYPFYSVDSTTWTLTPAYGQIIIPPIDQVTGEFNYFKRPMRIAVSGVNHTSISSQMKQFEVMGPLLKHTTNRFVEEECGLTVHECRYSPLARVQCVLTYFIKLAEHLRGVHFKEGRKPHLFNKYLTKRKPFEFDHVSIIFATLLGSKSWNKVLNDINPRPRLLSYYELRRKDDDIIHYVRDGLIENTRVIKQSSRAEEDPNYRNQRRIRLLHHLARNMDEE